MTTLSPYPKQKIAITFPTTQVEKAKKKAKQELGFNLPELVRHLVATYLRQPPLQVGAPKLSERREKQYLKELKAFYKQQQSNPQPAIHSAEELVARLEGV